MVQKVRFRASFLKKKFVLYFTIILFCDVIGLQETKRDGTSEISASGYRVFFSGDCTMVKGRKGQHGVGLAIKELGDR